MNRTTLTPCPWAGQTPLYQSYHDQEWGVPVHDDQKLFEFILLEGAQAGLSWSTILNKREAYRHAFDNFDVHKVARYGVRKKQSLLENQGIVRNRLKIESAVGNAVAFIKIQEEFGSFDKWLWRYVEGTPITNRFETMDQILPTTAVSDSLSGDLKKRGFKFVGSTIMYAFMQAVGMVNDHLVSCPRHGQIAGGNK
ncbi:MAG: DNA-3-methyladenine glycosylase I [Nitrospinota bacterium]|nr:DNA-3-methyladenine glycosylase I [Nitrospinota bacterium]